MITRTLLLSMIVCGACIVARAQPALPTLRLAWPEDESPWDRPRPDALDRVEVVRDTVRSLYPLLPLIFFEAHSAGIPERYPRFADSSETAGYADTIPKPGGSIQHSRLALNTVGYRMRHFSHTRIALVGGYTPETGETESLARERVETIRRYVVDVWRIDSARIDIRSAEPSADCDGDTACAAEGRFVRIESIEWDIRKPLDEREVRRYAIPESVAVTIEPEFPIVDVVAGEVELLRDGEPWFTQPVMIDEAAGVLRGAIDLSDAIRLEELDADRRVTARAVVTTVNGERRVSAECVIPVTVVERPPGVHDPDRRYEGYTVLLYECGGTELDAIGKRALEDVVIPSVAGSTVRLRVAGYDAPCAARPSDRERAEGRAEAVTDFLRRHYDSARVGDLSIETIGLSDVIFTNDLPEGRALNRTVVITINRLVSPHPEE